MSDVAKLEDLEYLRSRVQTIVDELDSPALGAVRHWPKGSNGPVAVAVYEALVERQERAVFMLRSALLRIDRSPLRVGSDD